MMQLVWWENVGGGRCASARYRSSGRDALVLVCILQKYQLPQYASLHSVPARILAGSLMMPLIIITRVTVASLQVRYLIGRLI